MADHITLQVTGLREMGVAIDHWGDQLEADARGELTREVQGTVNYMQATAPFKKGILQRSIKSQVESVGVSARIWTKDRKAHLVEWGHHGALYAKPRTVMVAPGVFRIVKESKPAGPHPFFIPNAIAARRRFLDRVKRLLQRPVPAIGQGNPEVRET